MIVLLETSPKHLQAIPDEMPGVEVAQFVSRARYAYRGGKFAIDNGAYAGFDREHFMRTLEKFLPYREHCLFVAAPDVVGSARRTLEAFHHWHPILKRDAWPVALVAQDGLEDLDIPWSLLEAVFIGGSTEWKCGRHAEAVIRCAQLQNKWVHVGRVNTRERYEKFKAMGVDSIDGSGIAQYTHMRKAMIEGNPLFEGEAA